MPGSGNTTVPGPSNAASPASPLSRLVPALILVYSLREAGRVGEVARLDDPRFPELVLGRLDEKVRTGEAAPDPRLLPFGRMAPGVPFSPSPLVGNDISRVQALLRLIAAGLSVESVGMAQFFINGTLMAPKTAHLARPGDVLQLGGHSAFLFTYVPASMPAMPGVTCEHGLGEPDVSGYVGDSFPAWDLRAQLVAALRIGGHAIVLGETGSGKELVARAVHARSGRRGPLVAFNCAAFVGTLTESTLFGNARNYPNVSTPETPGLLGEAQGGTLFLDEIGHMPRDLQAKLLRVLQADGEYMRLGETKPRRADVRIVAAMNQATSGLADDLLARFAYRIEMPPLSERMGDVPLLARHLVLRTLERNRELAERFVSTEGGRPHVRFAPAFVVALLRSTFAGGVRELDNLLQRAMHESAGDTIEQPSTMRPWKAPSLPPPAPAATADDTDRNDAVDAQDLLDGIRNLGQAAPVTDAEILAVLERNVGNRTKTAKQLNMSRDQLKRRLAKMKVRGIAPDESQ